MISHRSDGQRGTIHYRDFPIEDLFRDYVFEDVMHLTIWGHLPSEKEKVDVRAFIGEAAVPPQSVVDVILAFPFVFQIPNKIVEGPDNLTTDKTQKLTP